MKNSKYQYFYIASSLAILVPAPGRFAYGIILLVLFNLQMLSVSLIFHAVEHLNLPVLRNSIIAFILVAVTIFYKQLLIIFCPEAALTLGFCLYLPALTSAVIEFFFAEYKKGVRLHVALTMKKSLVISAFCLVFFLFRDIAGFGTFTFPLWKKIAVLHFPYKTESSGAGVLLATIPGCLILISVLLSIYIIFMKKMEKIGKMAEKNPSLLDSENFDEGDIKNKESEK